MTRQPLPPIAREILTDKQFRVLELYIVDNHSIRTIGRALHIDDSTVRSHLDRALMKMKPHTGRNTA